MNPLLILLTTVLLSPTEFAPTTSPVSTPKRHSQSLALHSGWNLVSWDIVPVQNVGPTIEMNEILPGPPDWLTSRNGQVYTWEHNSQEWYPNHPTEAAGWEWNPHYAYLMLLAESATPYPWQITSTSLTGTFTVTPDPTWRTSHPVVEPEITTRGWFFMGYGTNGYSKLSTIYKPTCWPPNNGSPACRDYRGPLHWMYWQQNADLNPHYGPNDQYLIIVKTVDGKIYLPYDPNNPHYPPTGGLGQEYDEIGTLQPGEGYFLGFNQPSSTNSGMVNFSWPANPTWQNNSLPPVPKNGSESQISSIAHFQFHSLSQLFYPIFVDTVVIEGDTIETGDEIGVFTSAGLCVGSAVYSGSFPVRLNAWEDDIATPEVLDGYTYGEEMTFKLYDQSRNEELTFTPPPGIMSVEENQVAPTHAGFGRGLYAWRSFTNGVQQVQQLPHDFKLGQNYPNPFNSETIIPLELPQRSHLKIELFNVRGQCLGVIFEGVENAGWPKIHYNSSNRASGMYFCRVTAEGLERGGKFQSVDKMLVLK
jgi:hypothetical protein